MFYYGQRDEYLRKYRRGCGAFCLPNIIVGMSIRDTVLI